MELVNTAVIWISWALAAYMVGVTIFLAANIAIGAIKTRSALWWYLVYSVVVVGMMLAGLKYLPSMVLEYSNDGIEAAGPEMARFAENVRDIFNTAAGGAPPPGNAAAGAQPTAVPATPASIGGGSTDGSDPDAGGGVVIPPTMTPVLTTPTLAPTATPDYQATADGRLATAQAVKATPTIGATPTYDILKPPTPIIQQP